MVLVVSPYAGDTRSNLGYLQGCLLDCISRGEVPLASHQLYTQVLDDNSPPERAIGMRLSRQLIQRCDAVIVYHDLGVSKGMQEEIEYAASLGKPLQARTLLLGEDASETLPPWTRNPSPPMGIDAAKEKPQPASLASSVAHPTCN